MRLARWDRQLARVTCVCLGLAALIVWVSESAIAQTRPARPYAPLNSSAGTEAERERARLVGLLTFRTITAEFNDALIRDVLAELSRQIGERVVGRFSDDKPGHGISPENTISATFTASTARHALEEVLNQCDGQVTWQLRNGYIEVGTKARLASSAAREVRMYHLRDLMIDPPYFASGGNLRDRRGEPTRKTPEYIAAQLFAAVLEFAEPEAWEPADDELDDTLLRKKEAPQLTPPLPPTLHPGTAQQRATEWVDYHIKFRGELKMRGKWATARIFRDQLIVNASDFIHRQIDGYPAPTVPADPNPTATSDSRPIGTAVSPAAASN